MCRTPWLSAASLLAALALALCVAGAAEPAHASGARFGDPALPANGPDTGDDGAVLGAVAAIAADGAASGSPVALAAVAVIAADGSATPSCDIASLVLLVNNALRAEAARHVAEYKALLGADAAEHEARQLAEVTDECEAASDARYYLLKSIVDGLTSDVNGLKPAFAGLVSKCDDLASGVDGLESKLDESERALYAAQTAAHLAAAEILGMAEHIAHLKRFMDDVMDFTGQNHTISGMHAHYKASRLQSKVREEGGGGGDSVGNN